MFMEIPVNISTMLKMVFHDVLKCNLFLLHKAEFSAATSSFQKRNYSKLLTTGIYIYLFMCVQLYANHYI